MVNKGTKILKRVLPQTPKVSIKGPTNLLSSLCKIASTALHGVEGSMNFQAEGARFYSKKLGDKGMEIG